MVFRATGARAAMLLGCLIFSSGAALTHWTLDWGLGWVAVTYGFVSALGQVRRYHRPQTHVLLCIIIFKSS